MELFEFILEEKNGEQEYSYNNIVWASSLKKAEKIAHEYAKTFYDCGGTYDHETDEYDFGDGIYVRILEVKEIKIEQWLKESLKKDLINNNPEIRDFNISITYEYN